MLKEPRDPKDSYRDEGVAKVLRAARARVIDEPMTAAEMMKAIRRGQLRLRRYPC